MLISTKCTHGFMSNLIKKSWTDSNPNPRQSGDPTLIWLCICFKNYGFTYIAVTAYFVASAVQWFERPLASCWASTSRENGS